MPSAIQLDPALLAAGAWLWTGTAWVKCSGDSTGRLRVNLAGSEIILNTYTYPTAGTHNVAVQSVPANQTVRPPTGVGLTARATATAQIKPSPGRVFWLSVSNNASGTFSWQLLNGTTDAAAALWWILAGISFIQHFSFFPPIEFSTAIRLKVDSTSTWWSVGYE